MAVKRTGAIGILLAGTLSMACALNSVVTYKQPTPTLMECGQTTDSAKETQLIEWINRERVNNNLPEWKIHPNLMRAARIHSSDMACHDYFSNDDQEGNAWHEMMADAGYLVSYGTENIVGGDSDPESVLLRLMNNVDDSGYLLVLDPIPVDVGVGHARLEGTKYIEYWTIFAAKPSAFQ